MEPDLVWWCQRSLLSLGVGTAYPVFLHCTSPSLTRYLIKFDLDPNPCPLSSFCTRSKKAMMPDCLGLLLWLIRAAGRGRKEGARQGRDLEGLGTISLAFGH
jgi:hypothetical protein